VPLRWRSLHVRRVATSISAGGLGAVKWRRSWGQAGRVETGEFGAARGTVRSWRLAGPSLKRNVAPAGFLFLHFTIPVCGRVVLDAWVLVIMSWTLIGPDRDHRDTVFPTVEPPSIWQK
jgi:hypothetical protein